MQRKRYAPILTLSLSLLLLLLAAPTALHAQEVSEDCLTVVGPPAKNGGEQPCVIPIGPAGAASAAPAKVAAPGSLTTGFVGSFFFGGFDTGHFFDVTVTTPLEITGFDVHLNTFAALAITVYWRLGTSSGFETNAGAWTMLGSEVVTANGFTFPTPVNVGGLMLVPGQTYGLYIEGGPMVFNVFGPTTFANADMSLTTDVASVFTPFANPQVGIEWDGTVYYDTGQPDLELDKVCEVNDDGTGTYELTLSNTGDADATGVRVQDWLPPLIDDVDGTPSQGTFSNGSGLWIVGDLDAGESAELEIDFTFDPDVPGLYLNHAEVVAVNEDDADSTPDDGMGDDYDECGFVVSPDRSVADFVPEQGAGGVTERGKRFQADLEVTKSVSAETAAVGAMVHYTVTLGNNGPHATAKVQVTDHLPECLVDATWETSRGTYDGWIWDLGAVKVGQTDSLEVWATVGETCDGTVTNKAWVSRTTLPDPPVSPDNAEGPLEGPFEERETLRNNHAEASFDVEASGRVLNGTAFALGNNYPNPFNPTTMVPFSLAEAAHVSIKVYDLLGREVVVLVDSRMSAGVHEVAFEAKALPTGVYLIRMEAAGVVQIQRVTLMK